MATKPTIIPNWATLGTILTVVEPLLAKKNEGWAVAEKPAAQHLNWLLKTLGLWCAWVDDINNNTQTWVRQVFQGAGSQAGITTTGGPTNAPGIVATGGGNAPGVQATGAGTGAGIQATGGTGAPALDCLSGGVKFSGTALVNSVDPGANVLHGLGAAKAVAHITTNGSGGFTLATDGLNIASVNLTTTYVEVTFARAFASVVYMPVAFSVGGAHWTHGSVASTSVVRVFTRDSAGAIVNPQGATPIGFVLAVFGRH
jgi:hypothetical protein